MIWWLVFEKKPFQFWWEIWIQVVVILLQLYLVIWKSKLRSEANLSKRSTQNPEQHRRIFESSFLASWVIFTPMIWSSCLSWHSTPFVYCSDGDEPIQICILLQYSAPMYLLLPLGKWGSKWVDFHWAKAPSDSPMWQLTDYGHPMKT